MIKQFSKICTNLKRHNCVHILSSKHTYRPMIACIVAQLFYIVEYYTYTSSESTGQSSKEADLWDSSLRQLREMPTSVTMQNFCPATTLNVKVVNMVKNQTLCPKLMYSQYMHSTYVIVTGPRQVQFRKYSGNTFYDWTSMLRKANLKLSKAKPGATILH